MVRFLACLLALGGTALSGAELRTPSLGKLPAQQFQNLWSKSLSGPESRLGTLAGPEAAAASHTTTCSIPLAEIKSQRTLHNPGVITAGNGKLDPIGKPMGDSVCKNWLAH